jgi:uncharacterized protein (TIGR03118 family)
MKYRRTCAALGCASLTTIVTVAAVGCGSSGSGGPGFVQTNLVSNLPGKAPVTDGNLLNPWGIAHGPASPWWVSNNHSGTSTLYDGAGDPFPPSPASALVVTIPPPLNSDPGALASPTGIVFNPTNSLTDFVITSGTASGPAVFIFATEDGTISAWNPNVDMTAARLAVDNSDEEAIYKGIAIGSNSSGNFIYASNFHAGTVDAFDGKFTTALSGSFIDSNIPKGFAPFGIQNINGDIYVTYAKQNAEKTDDVHGLGNGYVDIFDNTGTFVRRFASQGQLNSPWGVVLAPASFGRFGGTIIIGNFGDGHLNAFDSGSGTFEGQLSQPNGGSLTIPGLWGLGFGNGGNAGSVDTLYFTAGPNDESNGFFGTLTPAD